MARPRLAVRYLLRDREVTNFTYELANTDELVDFVAGALGVSAEEVRGYIDELDADVEWKEGLAARLRTRPDRNHVPRFGRRLGWYAIVRILRPELVVETGVHDGLGSAILLRALERNAADGSDGSLLAFDIAPGSGWLVDRERQDRYRLVLGDIRTTLAPALAGRRVGTFLHDSLHTYEHERFEFALALEHAAERLALISDNAHVSSALADICRERGLSYAFFRERPRDHFYPGAAIGLGLGHVGRCGVTAPAG